MKVVPWKENPKIYLVNNNKNIVLGVVLGSEKIVKRSCPH